MPGGSSFLHRNLVCKPHLLLLKQGRGFQNRRTGPWSFLFNVCLMSPFGISYLSYLGTPAELSNLKSEV